MAGYVNIKGTGDLAIINTQISTSKTVAIPDPFDPSRPPITFYAGEKGKSGNVTIISTGNLTFDNTVIQSATQGIDPSGNVFILSPGIVTFQNNSQIISNTKDTGQAGSVTVNAGQGITLTSGSKISAISETAPDTLLPIDSEILPIDNLEILSIDNLEILPIDDSEFTLIDGSEFSLAELLAALGFELPTFGSAGTITLNAPILTVMGNAEISAETQSSGQGGSIVVNAPTAVNLMRVQNFSPVLSVETSGSGQAGNIVVNTPSLTLADKARITATATSTSTNLQGGGSITLNASTMNLAGTVGVFAETQGVTPAGTLRLNPYDNQPDLNVSLTTNSRISASTSGSGNGGDLILTAPRSITLTGPGQLAVETSNTGNAGNINVATQQLSLRDGVELSASTSSSGKAGDINIAASSVDLSGGARVTTNTAGSGQAGSINLQVREQLQLTGAGTGLFASTAPGSSGNGGNITIAPQTLLVQDRATIAVNSQGQGQGGNISVQAGRVELRDRGSITAETASTQGGNITLNVQDLLLLRRNSLISTTAGTAQAGGNGGNIKISAPFVIGVLSENSDIRANAFTGQGGRVDITAQGIFGLKFQPRDTPRSDITASSEFGISGQVVLNTPGIDPSQGLTELPGDLTDPSNQINQVCANRNSANENANEFVVTGRGGLPPNPTTPLTGDELMAGWVSMPREAAPNPATVASQPAPPPAIVEAQGWVVDAAGNVTLVAHTETGLTRLNSVIPQNCR